MRDAAAFITSLPKKEVAPCGFNRSSGNAGDGSLASRKSLSPLAPSERAMLAFYLPWIVGLAILEMWVSGLKVTYAAMPARKQLKPTVILLE